MYTTPTSHSNPNKAQMLFSFILSLFAATAVFAHNHHGSKACTRELEGIVYVPANCAFNYLSKLANVLRVQAPLLWTAQAKSVIDTFEGTYGISVYVIDSLGNYGTFDDAGVFTANILAPLKAFDHSYERSNALGEGFTANTIIAGDATLVDYYTTTIWNANGQMYTIGLALDSSKAPNFC